jgi:hypothetical protein
MEETKNAHKIVVEKPEEKRDLGTDGSWYWPVAVSHEYRNKVSKERTYWLAERLSASQELCSMEVDSSWLSFYTNQMLHYKNSHFASYLERLGLKSQSRDWLSWVKFCCKHKERTRQTPFSISCSIHHS